ncbi:hypothetical protein ACP4OV_019390 [Aristida adscensionis]
MTMCSRPSAPPAVEAEALAALSDLATGASHAFVEDGVEVLLVYSKEVSRCLLNLGAHSPRNSPLPWKPAVVEQRNREDKRRRFKQGGVWACDGQCRRLGFRPVEHQPVTGTGMLGSEQRGPCLLARDCVLNPAPAALGVPPSDSGNRRCLLEVIHGTETYMLVSIVGKELILAAESSQHSDKQNIDGYRELKNIMVLCGLSGIHGWGLFAASKFQEGQMLFSVHIGTSNFRPEMNGFMDYPRKTRQKFINMMRAFKLFKWIVKYSQEHNL